MNGAQGRVIVVGAGILGTMHAFMSLERGFDVVHLEQDLAARGASVRNFGLVWVGGRARGAELDLARRARRLWEEAAGRVPGLDFRPVGSLTVALDDDELRLMKEAAQQPDAALRQWELLDGPGALEVNPELSSSVVGALYCRADAIVEPRLAVHALRRHLSSRPRYTWRPGTTVVQLGERSARDASGTWYAGDRVFLCPGAAHGGLISQYVGAVPTRRVRLQMLQTAPYPGPVSTALADGDSMRYYPAFDLPGRAVLGHQAELPRAFAAQLLVVQRLDGGLTIGDTHDYDEPFAFDLEEEIYDYLLARAGQVLRRPVPAVERRWAGVYSEVMDKQAHLYWRQELVRGVEVVSGPGGRGMTCAPAIAEDSMVFAAP